MVTLLELWLPVLLAGGLVFVVSSVIHVCLPIHKGDYKMLPGEDEVLATMKSQGVTRGQYMFPRPESMKDMGSPQMIEKFERGPVGYAVILPNGLPSMGRSLLQWFVFTLLVGVFTAYLATLALKSGAPYGDVFRFTSTVAFLGYGVGVLNDSIWKGVQWRITLKHVFGGVLYALVTAGAFAGFWPAA